MSTMRAPKFSQLFSKKLHTKKSEKCLFSLTPRNHSFSGHPLSQTGGWVFSVLGRCRKVSFSAFFPDTFEQSFLSFPRVTIQGPHFFEQLKKETEKSVFSGFLLLLRNVSFRRELWGKTSRIRDSARGRKAEKSHFFSVFVSLLDHFFGGAMLCLSHSAKKERFTLFSAFSPFRFFKGLTVVSPSFEVLFLLFFAFFCSLPGPREIFYVWRPPPGADRGPFRARKRWLRAR